MKSEKRIVAYPAILDDSENPKGMYTVTFPDVPGAISQGMGVPEAMANGSEALGLMLYNEEKLPNVSDIKEIQKENQGSLVTMIFSDLAEAKKHVKTPMVKKNTTIPGDLAQKAEEAGINFSKTLTEALEQKLNTSY
ncbi:type II toxin-antitoxin system HicB family antitoxin [Limosilactobacillus reuteri]|uniref:type II toxin-antitoxin system HicB family antitoxin n=1 Tax=Limosilactobacillus reuteri TaxID=1598 RepID=UPI001E3BC099|nr:type II toxin-antitoxin system HicB family antitoxin [Limosilactobacillus reuteri]MCC4367604.1 type II toxin-antitoxin system HicB family antitoxin [Limosilactobacillus reuteri]